MLFTDLPDGLVAGGSLHAVVRTVVRVVAVAVPFMIGFVVFRVVADEVMQRETVMRSDEVDRSTSSAARRGVQVAASGQTSRQSAEPEPALPKASNIVPEAIIPFRPTRWESTDLIAALAHIPRLGNELDARQDGILPHRRQEGRVGVKGIGRARQRGGEVEAEAVDMHLFDPVAEAVHYELKHARLGQIEAVAGVGIVDAAARIMGIQPVIDGVIQPSQRQGRPRLAGFRRMVVDHIQEHLDPGCVQGAHHGLELAHNVLRRGAACITSIRRKKGESVVSPVVLQAEPDQAMFVDVMVHRQQFDSRDTQFFQVLDGGFRAEPEVSAPDRFRNAGMPLREALDV